MELLLVSMLLLGPMTALKTEPGRRCSDISSWSPVVWQEGSSPCCKLRSIEPVCETVPKEVCVEFEETTCEIEVVEECTLTACDVEVTMPGQEEKEYEPNACKEEMVEKTQTKKRPVEVEKVRQECDTIWVTDEQGEMVWGGDENCIDVKHIEFEFEDYEITVRVRESMCYKLPPIKYLTCTNMTITQPHLCSSCEPKAVAKCEVKARTACQEVVNKSCKPQTNTECSMRSWEPDQTLTHKQRCTGNNSADKGDDGEAVVDAKTGAEDEVVEGEAEETEAQDNPLLEGLLEDTLFEDEDADEDPFSDADEDEDEDEFDEEQA